MFGKKKQAPTDKAATPGQSQANPKNQPKVKKTFEQNVLEWVKAIIFALAVMIPLRSSVIDWFDVPSGSMEPTVVPGDRIFVNKLAYGLRVPLTFIWIAKWDAPERGEIIICHAPEKGQTRLVKRAVGIPGDTIELRDNKLFVNGVAATYAELDDEIANQIDRTANGGMVFALETVDGKSHPIATAPRVRSNVRSYGPIEVPEGKILVIGDSRDLSRDSRFFGFVDQKTVVGRSPAVVFSYRKLPGRGLKIKWDRFFRGIS